MNEERLRAETRRRPRAAPGEGEPDEPNVERWLVSYADFITVLMALFLVLYAISEIDKAKFAAMAQGIRVGFLGPGSIVVASQDGGRARVVGSLYPSGSVENWVDPQNDYLKVEQLLPLRDRTATPETPPSAPKPSSTAAPVQTRPAQPSENDLLQRFQQDLSGLSIAGTDISSYLNERGLVVSIVGRYLFEPGSPDLKADAATALRPLAERLRSFDRTIMVEGYPGQGETPAGMLPNDLGTRRAAAVVSFLSGQGLPASHLVTVGFGEVSSSAQGRVDLVIVRRSGE